MLLGLAIGRIGCLMNGCCFGAVCDHAWAIDLSRRHAALLTPPYAPKSSAARCTASRSAAIPKPSRRVLAVDPDSPADRAGLKPGDRLRSINGPRSADDRPSAASRSDKAFQRAAAARIFEVEGRPGDHACRRSRRRARSLPVHPTQIYSTIDALLLCLLLLAYDPFRRRDGELFALMMSIYPVTRFLHRKPAERRGARVRHGHEHFAKRQPPVADLRGGAVVLYPSPAENVYGVWAPDERQGMKGSAAQVRLAVFVERPTARSAPRSNSKPPRPCGR